MNRVFKFFDDMLKSVYDFKFLANVVSRKTVKEGFLVLAVISVVYGLILGGLYAKVFESFAPVIGEEIARQFPDFKIKDGVLTSPVKQPYIFTLGDLSEDFFKEMDAWAEKWTKKGPSDIRTMKSALKYYLMSADVKATAFAFVLDTTGGYTQVINPQQFREFMLLEKERLYYRSKNGTEKEFLFKDYKTNAVDFSAGQIKPFFEKAVRSFERAIPFLFMIVIFIQFLMKAAFISLIGIGLSKITRRRIKYKNIFLISIYALLPVVAVGIIHNFVFGLAPVISVLVYAGYVACGIVMFGREEIVQV